MRIAFAALVLTPLLLTGIAQAQLRSTSLKKENEKTLRGFQKRNEKISKAFPSATKPSRLAQWKDHPNAARDAVEKACGIAARDSKMVFITSLSPPCSYCVEFFNYHLLREVNEILGKYYVIVDIDLEFMPDGMATFSKYAEPSFPSWVIISPKKKVIVDSYSPKGNVGYPLAPSAMAYYFAALKKATPAITENDLGWLTVYLHEATTMPNPWKQPGDFCNIVGHQGF
jgi:hypothetical protein